MDVSSVRVTIICGALGNVDRRPIGIRDARVTRHQVVLDSWVRMYVLWCAERRARDRPGSVGRVRASVERQPTSAVWVPL